MIPKLAHLAKTLITASLWLSVMATAGAKDLIGVYEDALRNDPVIRAADANRLASHESRPQALAALLPQIFGSASYSRERLSGAQTQPYPLPPTGAGLPSPGLVVQPLDYVTDPSERQWAVTLRQNVFSWSNWLTLKAANAQVAQAEATYVAAQQSLIFRVAQAYANVLSAQDNLDAQQAFFEAVAGQLEQADRRHKVGLIAITDVQEAEAARDSASAAVIAAKRTTATAKYQLEEITGKKYDMLSKPGTDMPLDMPEPADEDRWVSISLEQNATLISSRLAADIARDNVSVAVGAHLPTIDLVVGRSHLNQTGPYESAGYKIGTRTAVDVLNARRILVQAQTDYSGSRYDYIISLIQLRLAAGNLDRAQLEEINGWLTVSASTSAR